MKKIIYSSKLEYEKIKNEYIVQYTKYFIDNKISSINYFKVPCKKFNNYIKNNFNFNMIDEELHYYRHNDLGPAIIHYQANGLRLREYYYKNGVLHRDDFKPSYLEYDSRGNVFYKQYFNNGECYDCKTNKQFKKMLMLENIK